MGTVSEHAGFRDPSECAACHPVHAEEWSISPHAYALRDPVFAAMVRLGQRDTQGKLGQFCVRCHSPIADETDQTPVQKNAAGEWFQDLEAVDPIAKKGVSCDACHTINNVHTTANAGVDFDPRGPRRATIADPIDTDAHESLPSDLHAESRLCGSCHQVVSEFFTERVALERTFAEWVTSGFNGSKSCQQCHMPTYRGRAAVFGPERTVHRHCFEAVDVSLLPPDEFPGYDRLRELSEALLRTTLELSVRADTEASEPALIVSLRNLAGHSLPSGATVDRELWVEVVVRDAKGTTVFESGTLDAEGDLRDLASSVPRDPQLTVFRQKLYFDPKLEDPRSTEPRRRVHFLWEPNTEESHLIRAAETVRPRYSLGELPRGKYDVSVRVRMRAFAPRLLRDLEARAGLSPDVRARMPTFELASEELGFDVP